MTELVTMGLVMTITSVLAFLYIHAAGEDYNRLADEIEKRKFRRIFLGE